MPLVTWSPLLEDSVGRKTASLPAGVGNGRDENWGKAMLVHCATSGGPFTTLGSVVGC